MVRSRCHGFLEFGATRSPHDPRLPLSISPVADATAPGGYAAFTAFQRASGNLIICEKYNHYSAIVNASKAAYIATLLKYGIDEITRYWPSTDVAKLKLFPTVHPALSKIRTFRPEAYYYWYEISRIKNAYSVNHFSSN